MTAAIILFAVTYVLMLTFGQYRPLIALASGLIFIVTGMLPVSEIPSVFPPRIWRTRSPVPFAAQACRR